MEIDNRKEKIKACVAILIVILIIITALIIIIKYSVEGETNMPFKLSKITVVSTAEGVQKEESAEKWNLQIFQNNDLYFSIEKNENYKEEAIIKNIVIDNIQITKTPNIGEIKPYMPNSSEGRTFSYSDDYIILNNKLTYGGASKTDTKTLEISNQGGTAVIRFSNTGIGEYVSDEDEEIVHDGSLISKISANKEDIKFSVEFDFIINMKDKSYKTHINLQLPCNNLIENGTDNMELKDFIFKRI